jgi:hypothetical protein
MIPSTSPGRIKSSQAAVDLPAGSDGADVHLLGVLVDGKHDPPVSDASRSAPTWTLERFGVGAKRGGELLEAVCYALLCGSWETLEVAGGRSAELDIEAHRPSFWRSSLSETTSPRAISASPALTRASSLGVSVSSGCASH